MSEFFLKRWKREASQEIQRGEKVLKRAYSYYKSCFNRECTEHPVVLSSGVKVSYDTDFVLHGTPLIEFTRVYVGDMHYIGALGRNRIGALDEMLAFEADGSLIYRMASGDIACFERPSPNLGQSEQVSGYPYMSVSAGRAGSFVVQHGPLSKTFHKYDDGNCYLSEIRDRNENFVQFTRDEGGRLTQTNRSDGFVVLLDNDKNGLRVAVTVRAPDGATRLITRNTYDHRQNLVEVDNSYKPSFKYKYDALDRLIEYDDGASTRVEYSYDEVGRVCRVVTPSCIFDHTISYGPRAATLTFGDRPDALKIYKFDANGYATSVENGLGHVKTYEYNDHGTLVADTSAEGNRTTYTYDPNGGLTSIVDPEGHRTIIRRDSDGRQTLLVSPEGESWAWSYDERGNLSSMRDALGARLDWVFNPAGFPVRVMRHDGLIEQYTYDAHNNLVSLIDFRGSKTSFKRDSFGRVTRKFDALSGATHYTYDGSPGADFWMPTAITRPDGVTVTRVFERNNATSTAVNGEGQHTIYRHGPFGLLNEVEDPQSGRLSLAYDHAKQVIAIKNQVGRTWTFERDAAGRVVRETDFDGMVRRYGYDRSDRLVELRYDDGTKIKFDYDRSGLLLRESAFGPGGLEELQVTRWDYDANGRLRSGHNENGDVFFERDALGRVTAETMNGHRIESVYDCCNNRLQTRAGENVVRSRYDPLGAMSELCVGDHPPLRFRLDAIGRELRRENGSGFLLDQSWSAVGHLLSQTAIAEHGDPVIQRCYLWSRSLAPVSVVDARWGEDRFEYNANGQVISARHGDASEETFSYTSTSDIEASSAKGSLQAWSRTPGGRVRQAWGPDGQTITLTYDARRRVTERLVEREGDLPRHWRYVWDGRNRLISCMTPAGDVWRYGYDAFARRIWKARDLSEEEQRFYAIRHPEHFDVAAMAQRGDMSVSRRSRLDTNAPGDMRPPTVGTSYAWDGDVMVAEAPLKLGGTVDWAEATRWHYASLDHTPLAREGADGTLDYVVTDFLGTPRELVDEKGVVRFAATYRLWGDRIVWRPAAETGSRRGVRPSEYGEPDLCPLRFQGQWADEETGLSYNRFRYYDPLTAQYVTPDPLGLLGGTRPLGYVSRPTTEIDPLGLYCCNKGHKYKTIHDQVCGRALSQSEGQDLIQRFTVPNGNAGNISPPGEYLVTQNGIPGGYVNTSYDLGTMTGTNVTTPYHAFQGTITRQITYSGGATYIDTNGSGNAGDNLVGLARDNLNSTLGPGVFAGLDSQAAAYAAANYPGC